MKEQLETFNLDNNIIGVQSRKEYYKEIEKEFAQTGKITKQVKQVRLIMMNSEGTIFIQRRSKRKDSNAGLYDKTTGGHVNAGHTWELTVVKECHEEFGFPAVVLSQADFKHAIEATDTAIIGLFREVEHINQFLSKRIRSKGEIVQPVITKNYIGYYDGPIRFKDGEAIGVECFTKEELEEDLKNHPTKFTEDLKFMVKRYGELLVPKTQLTATKQVQGF